MLIERLIVYLIVGAVRGEWILPRKTLKARNVKRRPAAFPQIQMLYRRTELSENDIEENEMHRVFNMGVGLVLVVSPFFAESIRQQFADHGMASWTIGEIVTGKGEATWK